MKMNATTKMRFNDRIRLITLMLLVSRLIMHVLTMKVMMVFIRLLTLILILQPRIQIFIIDKERSLIIGLIPILIHRLLVVLVTLAHIWRLKLVLIAIIFIQQCIAVAPFRT